MSPDRPLTAHNRPPAGVIVGSPRPLKLLQNHSLWPVWGSYAVTPVCPLRTNSVLPAASITIGVLQPRGPSRSVFQTVSPVRLLTPIMNGSRSASPFWITRLPTMTGHAATPQGPSNDPRSRDQ